MDPEAVQTPAHLAGKVHVFRRAKALDITVHLDVQAGNDLGVAELPDVQVVTADDSGEILDILLDPSDVKMDGDRLEKDAARGFAEGDCAEKDDNGDEKRDGGVEIVAPLVGSEPNEEGTDDHTDVAESVAKDVKEYTAHVEIGV